MNTKAAMPAYPYAETVYRFGNEETVVHEGMTKREVFAMAAMQAMAMRVCALLDSEVARAAVTLADATLSALEQQQE